ncbi:hypothetical protein HMPREF1219_01210 [Corynebacterium pyruviciproducens ATCC BAA-1742]|uniref:DUF202 domain-containing protein n=1 Tax=Corynebacterium pyruviciproducens ATCC BAA-1742 TaxID=1125779 RepID=S2ZH27_9CORY|nr:DUF202 domain-containing protein [Corynebacterium pyruviciproducens]EPD69342.1 hypothetical protein HMPREF1219_01210 [Corynebacterium pyruviciproducens ATCC BAA-1742]
MTPLPTHDDPGLQPERTTLSWSRTVLATCVCSATQIKFVDAYGPVVFIAVALLLTAAATILITHRSRYAHGVEAIREEEAGPNVWGVFGLAGLLVCFGAVTIAMIFFNASV